MLQRLSHIILAILVFIGTSGLVINKHYCQNELKSIAVFHKAESCHSKKDMAACPMHAKKDQEQGENERKDCCNDHSEIVKIDQEQSFPSLDLHLSSPPVVQPPFPPTLVLSIQMSDRHSLDYLNYKPPLIICDIPVMLQSLLC
ncbi:MAG: hypothetical protein R2824_12670 [Saprospiraceae bacterium]